MSEPTCDHDKGIHLRPVVLFSWRETRPVVFVRRVQVRCYACGRGWVEDRVEGRDG